MHPLILPLQDIDLSMHELAGGKAVHLGELIRINGLSVPRGFCITTEAFRRALAQVPDMEGLLDRLARLTVKDGSAVAALAGEIRSAIEAAGLPQDLAAELHRFYQSYGVQQSYAVRSSATAEDLPGASFAGQHESYLNIRGIDALQVHIVRCWASLFTERAVLYRMQYGFDHRSIGLCVIVQQMIFPQASGILFTADPISGNRTITSIDAGFGLGEALVSGLVNADTYKVQHGRITHRQVAVKTLAIGASPDGGVRQISLPIETQHQQVLTDEDILKLAALGRTIEQYFGKPQDIEWCLAEDVFYIVQSRPITTLFPAPEAPDKTPRAYLSVGHQQMMTDALTPLGLSFFQLTAFRPMSGAGGRLFVDITPQLSTTTGRMTLLKMMEQHDLLTRDAVETLLEIGFIPLSSDEGSQPVKPAIPPAQPAPQYDASTVSALIKRSEELIEVLKQDIRGKTGAALFDFIIEDVSRMKQHLSAPEHMGIIMAAIQATTWINEHMAEWLGEKNAADVLTQAAPNNITSEMGLALLDVADAIRPYPEVIAWLEHGQDKVFPDDLLACTGGPEAYAAILQYLQQYGMRCAGEIDIARPRWSEQPSILFPAILSNIRNFGPQESKRRLEAGRQEAAAKEADLLQRLRSLPGGTAHAEETQRKIDLLRQLVGFREYPKYHIISRFFVYRLSLLREAGALAEAGVIAEAPDVYYLTFEELRDLVATHQLRTGLLEQRKEQHRAFTRLKPPRVITSEGTVFNGAYKRTDLPADTLAGLAVSSGVIEGRARVISDMATADLQEGDILVTTFTDPSWTPLFVLIKGLVTEVGGLMTHGAVIAREYGIPAVVSVTDATKRIRDGQRIRVNGTEGYIAFLD